MICARLTRLIVALGVLSAYGAYLPAPTSSAEEYIFLSKKRAKWVYDVTLDEKKERRQYKGKLTIINEGETVFEGTKAIRFSWTSTYAGGLIREERVYLYLVPSPQGVLTVGTEVPGGPRSRYQPPLLWLKEPLQAGSAWESQGRIQTGGKTEDYRVRTTVQAQQVTVPAGQFETMKEVSQSSTSNETKWWAKGIGIVRIEYSARYVGRVAELVEYSIPGEAPGVAKATGEQSRVVAEEVAKRGPQQERTGSPTSPKAPPDFVKFGEDNDTGAIYGVTNPYTWHLKHEPCLFNMNTKDIHAIVSRAINLADAVLAKHLAEKALQAYMSVCPGVRDQTLKLQKQFRRSELRFKVNVNLHWESLGQLPTVYVEYEFPPSGQPVPTKVTNYAAVEAEKTKQAEREQTRVKKFLSSETIARQIEGFDLGMDLRQAEMRLKNGIQNGKLTVVNVLQFGLSPMFPNILNDHTYRRCSAKFPNICFQLPVKISTVFRASTAEAVQLSFYRSELFRIAVDPYVDGRQMMEALQVKYGLPTQEENTLLHTSHLWTDNKTSLTYYSSMPFSTYCCYNQTESVRFSLLYDDRNILELLEGDLRKLLNEQEREETQKRQRLPRSY